VPSHQQSQDSPRPLPQQRAVEILSALLKDATSLTHEPFASPKRIGMDKYRAGSTRKIGSDC